MTSKSNGNTAPAELIVNKSYSDERFIDMMAAHHAMAIDFAKLAKEKAEHEEIRDLAKNMISAQEKEIEKLSSMKKERFGSSEVPTRANPAERSMFAMLSSDKLAEQDPFDKAFIDSNLPHHASAIEMASVALMQSNNDDLKDLCRNIVEAQSKEVGKMIEWRDKWYSKSE